MSESDASGSSSPTVAQLQADIAARRARLASTVGELSQRTSPQALVEYNKSLVRQRFRAATHTPDGQLRTDRLVKVGLATAAAVGLVLLVRRRSRR